MMKGASFLIVWLLITFVFIEENIAQSTYYFKELGIEEGLSQSKVQSILNDYKGYLWIGTESGLNCYDRDLLKQFLHKEGDTASLPSNDIIFVAEDSLRNLWIATQAGLCLYDRSKECFQPILYDDYHVYITSYLLLEDGILLGGTGSLYKYEYESQHLVSLSLSQQMPEMTFINMLFYDSEHILINTQWQGVYLYNLRSGDIEKMNYLTDRNYPCCLIDSHQQLWVSSYGSGLYCYKEGKVLRHFSTHNSPLTYNVILDMIEKDNQLWLATDGGGINRISLDDFSFSHIQHVEDDIHSFPTNALFRLYKDKQQNIWIGSIRNGLIGVKEVYANSFRNVPLGNKHGLSNRTINSFFQDRDGIVWIGTDGGGLNSFDPVSRLLKHYPSTWQEKVVSVVEYSAEELLYFSFNKGFFIFNKVNGRVKPFILVNEEMNERICVNGFSVHIQRISEDKILFSGEDYIFVYDLTDKKFQEVAVKGEDYLRTSPLIIGTIGTKTYLADLNNICEYDVENNSFKTIYKGDYTIKDACIDKSGNFWLASTVGLVTYNIYTKKDQWIQTELFPEITSIIADEQKRVWIGTRHNLYVYSTDTEKFTVLGETDGVLPNEYIFQAHLVSREGDIYLGGTLGMTVVDSSIRFETETDFSIELLDVILNGLPVTMEEKYNQSIQTIEVPWNFSSLQLKVLLNEQNIFRENLFRFEIQGIEQGVIQSETNSLTVNYLPIGHYTITASYYAHNGEWSQFQPILQVVVLPPWWKSTLAYWGYLLMGLLALCGSYYTINKKKKMRQQREIERIKNKAYEEKINFLTNISHELRTPLTLICAPLKRIISHKQAVDDVERQLAPIYKQASQMKNIINMVLDVQKLEKGKEVLYILPYSLNDWIINVVENFAEEFATKNIQLLYELDERIKEVPFDKSKCEFVLSNFLMNALKFSEEGTSVTIRSEISEEESIRVSVIDQGIGLDMVDMNLLFSHFYQGTHDKGGSGIGLSYCKTLITHHEGKIGAINNVDKGATFFYELPIKQEKISKYGSVKQDLAGEGNEKEEELSLNYAYLKGFSILIVEDVRDLRNYLQDTLNSYFACVYVAKDGKEGLEMIKKMLPDIIVSDVMMPCMDGFELCQKVKTDIEISHLPFILLTAYSNAQNMQIGYKTGADAFLAKPFEVDVLLSLINNQLKLRENIRTRCKGDAILVSQEVSFSNADETFLLKLNTLIMDNIGNQKMDVAFLATNMCISRSLLFNKIKAITGMGIIDYVNKLRINKATELLNTTTMNLTEISESVGFSSLRYFSKVFKQQVGEIPSAYRKQ